MTRGWDASAEAWMDTQGEVGDFSRRRVLDAPMIERVRTFAPDHLLDLGCGEGRFCRLVASHVPDIVGLDPTRALLARARERGGAVFVEGVAEALPFEDGRFDMVVSYLSLIDIETIDEALDEVSRALRPGGRFLIANLQGFATAADIKASGWTIREDGAREIAMRRYLEPHAAHATRKGISVTNYHRPLAFYMQSLLGRGFALTHFDEPAVPDPKDWQDTVYNGAPYHLIMEWAAAR